MVLVRCSGVVPVDLSKGVQGWRQDESGTGEGFLQFVKLELHYPYTRIKNIVFQRKLK